jgi:hypothetical protein
MLTYNIPHGIRLTGTFSMDEAQLLCMEQDVLHDVRTWLSIQGIRVTD